MPYPNEHAARQNDPGKYVRVRRENDKLGSGIHVIWGVKDDGKTEVQALRFDASKFTADEAREWLEEHEYNTALEEASGDAASFQLEGIAAFQAISGVSMTKDRVPKRKFRKEIIRAGTYVKDEQEFEVTHSSLKNWVRQFRAMKRNGVKVPIPLSHEDDGDSDKNQGWVHDLFVEDESLFMTCELIGEDAIGTAARADVSLYSPPSFKDGKGNEYTRPITHVAMTTHPVVPGLGEFVPLAASLKHKETEMDLASLGKALSLDLGDKEKAEETITAAFSQLKKDLVGEKEKRGIVEKERDALKAETKKDNQVEPDPTLISLAADNRQMKLKQLVEAGRITPAVSDKLKTLYLGEENKALILSLKTGTQGQFDELVMALSENDPVKLKETSGQQTVALSDSKKGNNGTNVLLADAEKRAKAAAKA